MEYIFLAIGAAFAIFCVYFYRKGVKDGMAIKEGRLPSFNKPEILMTKDEREAKKEEREAEREQAKELSAIFNSQPKFVAHRGDDKE